jgi:hypothetical protein
LISKATGFGEVTLGHPRGFFGCKKRLPVSDGSVG